MSLNNNVKRKVFVHLEIAQLRLNAASQNVILLAITKIKGWNRV